MLVIVLISIFALPLCKSADHDQTSSEEQEQLERWTNLHKQIYSHHANYQIDLSDLKVILNELSSIEKSFSFKSRVRSSDEFYHKELERYKYLVETAYKLNVIADPDETITGVLLQLLNNDSNDCTTDHFNLLNDINKQFENSSTSKSLLDIRQMQFKDCLERSMRTLSGVTSLLAENVVNSLDNLLKFILPDPKAKFFQFGLIGTQEYCVESAHLTQRIAQYLHQQLETIRAPFIFDENITWKHFINHPCKSLIDETNHLIIKIQELLNYSQVKGGIMTAEQIRILNRYLLCDRIIADEPSMKSAVLQIIKLSFDFRPSNGSPIDLHPSQSDSEFGLSTELRLGFGDADEQLITQQLSPEDWNEYHFNEPNQSTLNDIQKVYVTKIGKAKNSGRNPSYPTEWSDGSKTTEKKSYLSVFWPDKLKESQRDLKRDKLNLMKARYAERRETKLSAQLPSYNPTTDNYSKKVTSIDRAIGRGSHARYPTNWSDGTQSMESRSYLLQFWSDKLDTALKQFAREDYAAYVEKCRARLGITKQKKSKNKDKSLVDQELARPENAIVISIDSIQNTRKTVAKYKTIWSDGTITQETRKYLLTRWPDAWEQYCDVRRERLRAKRTAKNLMNSNRKLVGLTRPRPILPKTFASQSQISSINIPPQNIAHPSQPPIWPGSFIGQPQYRPIIMNLAPSNQANMPVINPGQVFIESKSTSDDSSRENDE